MFKTDILSMFRLMILRIHINYTKNVIITILNAVNYF